ncbi:aromatic amino acid DMT transporter YddG [Vibrio methylphosphonaticus]|uniref:aromatic amino acid DMT transporter YddG n=1 Tax=Vibrio methylphosphonaticus TaxID=2946866 RepID=UPI00202ABF0C|nr:aromatic amino acid DMT transporter YddG [Vibrio methylphosphonaticus]MCL9776877.1 aromatic amino acid DMT transporter YddG [Vibrio methylphosphonaticus]
MAGLGANKYTLFGIGAILLWSCLLALTRNIAELFGPIGGAALMYTVSAVALVVVMGVPKLKTFSVKYLVVGGGLFVCYEIFLALALGMANDRHQAMEMAIINYLWPALTVLFAVMMSKRRINMMVYPSVLLAFFGVVWCITGDEGLSLDLIMKNIATNPISYFMAVSAAFIWAVYCNITPIMSNGKNAIVLFFIATASVLWIQYALSDEQGMTFSVSAVLILLLSGVVMGAGYALWNYAIIGGNMMLLATFSYFTPVLSTVFSSFYLSVALGASFWQGVTMVTIGSLTCYWATREKVKR